MKTTNILLVVMMTMSSVHWHHDLQEAKGIARQEHRHILLNFSGSDWCGPCIRMREIIFDSGAFQSMADSMLVLVNADFPRLKKNQLSRNQQQLNDAMADQYNPSGKFPYTLLLDAEGKIIKSWDGLPKEDATKFINEIHDAIDRDR